MPCSSQHPIGALGWVRLPQARHHPTQCGRWPPAHLSHPPSPRPGWGPRGRKPASCPSRPPAPSPSRLPGGPELQTPPSSAGPTAFTVFSRPHPLVASSASSSQRGCCPPQSRGDGDAGSGRGTCLGPRGSQVGVTGACGVPRPPLPGGGSHAQGDVCAVTWDRRCLFHTLLGRSLPVTVCGSPCGGTRLSPPTLTLLAAS